MISVEQKGIFFSLNDSELLSFTINILLSFMEEKSSVAQDKNETVWQD